jgi:hypothetical protein
MFYKGCKMAEFTNLSKKIAQDLNVATEIFSKFKDEKIVTIFGSARVPSTHEFFIDTKEIAKQLGKKGFTICTGGGPGLMLAASQGAKEGNAKTLGLSIKLPHEEKANEYLDENVLFQNFAQRKIAFSAITNAYVVVPGGFGSLDELFEVLTLMQCGIISKAPVVLYNKEYWDPLLTFISNSQLKEKMINSEDIDMIFVAETIEDVISYIIKEIN